MAPQIKVVMVSKTSEAIYSAKSAIAEHVHEQSMPHEINWQGMKAIDRARRKRERKIREAFHIQKRKPQLNRDGGVERSTIWNAFI